MPLTSTEAVITAVLSEVGSAAIGYSIPTLLRKTPVKTGLELVTTCYPKPRTGTRFQQSSSLSEIVSRAIYMARILGKAKVERVLAYLAKESDSIWNYRDDLLLGPFHAEDYQLAFNTLRHAFAGDSSPFERAFQEKYGTHNWKKACEQRADCIVRLLATTIPARIETLTGEQLALPLLVLISNNTHKQEQFNFAKPPQPVREASLEMAGD